jgi:hypothetical protein
VNAISDTPIHEGAADFRLVSWRVVEVFRRDVRERGLFLGLLRSGSPPPWSLPLAVFGLVSGAQLVFLGILGEYLGAVLDEVRARPHYVVEERINL